MAFPREITGVGDRPILLLEPHGDTRPNPLALRGDEVGTPMGARILNTKPAGGIGRHEFRFVCETHEERAWLDAFFDARRGRYEGFWYPTWQWEFDVYGYEMPNFNSYFLTVRHNDYAAEIFPLGAAYRHLLMTRGDTWHLHTIDAATPNSAAGFDLLHMAGPLGAHSTPDVTLYAANISATRNDAYRPLWLRYGRFDQDEIEPETLNSAEGSCIVRLAMVDAPEETPT